MNDCSTLSRKLVPLTKVVNAALIDTFENVGRSKELFSHWAARGLRKLQGETLKSTKGRAFLTVNHNTKTATLPPDFDYETFVGIIDPYRQKIPMTMNNNLTNDESIEDIPCDTLCEKCNQNTSICEDLEVTEETETVIVNAGTYTKTVVKKLYPNGDYFLETTIPYYNTVTETVEYATTKEFIVALDLKSCGCLETTEENIAKIRTCAPDVYDCYFSTCASTCDKSLGGYKIFEDTGVIQLDLKFKYDKIYIEYAGFMRKINGQYAVPQVAFETLVEYTKLKAIRNKKNVPIIVSETQLNDYRRERGNMLKQMGRVSLSSIITAARRIPRFQIEWRDDCPTKCAATSSPYVSQITSSDVCGTSPTTITENGCTRCLSPFQLAVKAGTGTGTPVEGEFTYYNPELVGALNLNTILVNRNDETILDGDFTFDSATGIITRVNKWFDGDTLIASFAKYI